MSRTGRTSRRDPGLTLVELIIVTTVIGLVATVIAATFVTILRIAPSTQFRIDDARSTRGLQTWLARDIASTPPNLAIIAGEGGYIFSTSEPSDAQRCGISSGVNVLHMTWVEAGGSGIEYHANYRLIPSGSEFKVVRYVCSSAITAPTSVSLTSGISSTPCPSQPSFSVGNLKVGDLESVDICVVSLESESGLNGGTLASQEVKISVSSRNYLETF